MKQKIKTNIRKSVGLEKAILRVLGSAENVFQYTYKSYLDQKVFKEYCKNRLEVKQGIFKGMKYPSMEAAGSALGLKLAGMYEEELIPVLERIMQKGYEKIIDIGSAEGYYAIGLARAMEEVEVEAYDIDPYARKLLDGMRKINCVDSRVHINSLCTKETLINMELGKKSLVISDCEGFEKELFDKESAGALQSVDILVEVHDNLEKGEHCIYDQIYEALKDTHNIEEITSISVAEKICNHSASDLNMILKTDNEWIAFMKERAWRMKWLFLQAKSC